MFKLNKLTNIPQVTYLLTLRPPQFDPWISVFWSDWHLQSRKLLEVADQTEKPPCSVPAAVFFGAAGRHVLPLSLSLDVDRGHAHSVGA
jgi:hypothetical protein